MNHPRHFQHISARKMMAAGQFADALALLKSSGQEYGPHILNSIDTASCYYMLNDFESYSNLTRKLTAEIFDYESILSDKTWTQSCLGLGKLLEEQCQLMDALELYDKALKRDIFINQRIKIQACKLRILSFLKIEKKLQDYYHFCDKAFDQNESHDIDLQHALMLADLKLFSTKIALKRLNQALGKPLSVSDRNLFIFDFLYEYLLKSDDLDLNLIELLVKDVNYWDLDHFEKIIFDIIQVYMNKSPLDQIDELRIKNLSKMSSLKITFLICKLSRLDLDKKIVKDKFLFLFRSLQKKDQVVLKDVWKFSSKTQLVYLDSKNKKLIFGEQQFSIKDYPVILKLLELYSKKSIYSVEEVVNQLYESEVTVNSIDRLRILVSRTNKIAFSNLGLHDFFKLTKNKLELNYVIVRGELK